MMNSGEGYFKITKSYIADLTSLLKSDISVSQMSVSFRGSLPSSSEQTQHED
jgi:hypothetical protein